MIVTLPAFHGCYKSASAPLGPPADDFNRADSATSLGTSSSGHVWVPLGGTTWGISSNKAYLPSASTQTVAYCEANDADVTIEVVLSKSDATNNLNRMGISFRLTDDSNYLYAYFLSSTSLRLFKKVTGAGTQLGLATVTETSGDGLKVIANGDQIEVYHNGVLKIGPITESFNQTATKHGLFHETGGSLGTVCRWDDFSVV